MLVVRASLSAHVRICSPQKRTLGGLLATNTTRLATSHLVTMAPKSTTKRKAAADAGETKPKKAAKAAAKPRAKAEKAEKASAAAVPTTDGDAAFIIEHWCVVQCVWWLHTLLKHTTTTHMHAVNPEAYSKHGQTNSSRQ